LEGEGFGAAAMGRAATVVSSGESSESKVAAAPLIPPKPLPPPW
jgi:hypothetical protein